MPIHIPNLAKAPPLKPLLCCELSLRTVSRKSNYPGTVRLPTPLMQSIPLPFSDDCRPDFLVLKDPLHPRTLNPPPGCTKLLPPPLPLHLPLISTLNASRLPFPVRFISANPLSRCASSRLISTARSTEKRFPMFSVIAITFLI